jgi:aminoglycoside phosphotransferase (APT) family kinase protein
MRPTDAPRATRTEVGQGSPGGSTASGTILAMDPQPPKPALEWAARSAGRGARVVRARPLPGGGWHANHLLELELPGGRRLTLVLRRWARPGWEVDDLDMTPAREAAVLERLEHAGLSTPRLVAIDAAGSEAGAPALLETVVPGSPIRRPRDAIAFARALAEPLLAIHAVPVNPPVDAASIPYRRYYDPTALVAPDWAADRRTWERAIEFGSLAAPDAQPTFIHRDYHPGNVLWSRRTGGGMRQVSGIVDWTSASFGPPAVDVGHMRWNLAASFGQAVADAFLDASHELGIAPGYSPEWDIRTSLDVLPELRPGDDPMAELRRIEEHVAGALAELG